MYYLFLRNGKKLREYRRELERVIESIERGKTPVYNEMRSAKTNLVESLPYHIINGCFLILGTILLSKMNIPEIIKIAAVLIVNNVFGALSNYLFTIIKHRLRVALCRRMNVAPSESIIAAMESLEYQSV